MRLALIALATFVVFTILFEFHSQTVSTLYQWYRADLSETASGTIQMADLRFHYGRGKEPECEVMYTYTSHAGTFHQSSLVSYLGEQYDPYGTCEKYKSGDLVTVYYDPTNPSHSALELTKLGWDVYFDVATIFVASLVFILWLEFSGSSASGSDSGCGGGDGGD